MIDRPMVSLLNRFLRQQSWARERLLRHAGRHCVIQATPFQLGLGIQSDGLFSPETPGDTPDVRITLPADAAFRLLGKPESLLAGVRIEGSVDLAEDLGFVLRHLEFDLEGELASVIGDIPAHRLARTGRALKAGVGEAVRRSAENLRDYSVHESRQLVSPPELASFGQAVSSLRDDLARLEKRIARL